MKVGAKGRPVKIDVDQADLEMAGWFDVQSAAHFDGKAALGSLVPTSATDGDVEAGAASQGFNKWDYAPAVASTGKRRGP